MTVDVLGTGVDVVNLADNDDQQIISGATAADAVSLGGTMTAGSQPVTFAETGGNTGTFVNFDESNNANMFVTSDALRGTAATVDYNDTQMTILAVEPKDAARSLKNDIQRLIDIGSLDEKKGNKLIKKLDQFLEKLDNGKIDKACKKMNKFVKQVNKLVDKDKLAQANGESLTNTAERIKTAIDC